MSTRETLRLLNLEVVAGALAGGWLAVELTGARVGSSWWLLLGGATFVVYGVDRLLDARRLGASSSTLRHRTYARHRRRVLAATALVASITSLGAWFTLPRAALPLGLVLLGATALYLGAVQTAHRRRFPKELSAATIYTLGIWFVPLAVAQRGPQHFAIPLLLHGIAALANLLLYGLFEIESDRADDHNSLARAVGVDALRLRLALLTACGLALCGVGIAWGPDGTRGVYWFLTGLIGLPLAMLAGEGFFRSRERYRLVGDFWIRQPRSAGMALDVSEARGFDRLSPFYDVGTRAFFLGAIESSRTRFLDRLLDRRAALIVGGGTGAFLTSLAKAGFRGRVTYLEPSGEMTRRARRRLSRKAPGFLPRVEWRREPIELASGLAGFDLVCTHYVLDLFDPPRLARVMERLDAALLPEGLWHHADFIAPSGRGPASWGKRATLRALYRFFRVTCAIPARRLPPISAEFARLGYRATNRSAAGRGMLETALFRRGPALPRGSLDDTMNSG